MRHKIALIVAITYLFTIAVPAFADSTDFKSVLAGTEMPLTMTLKDLDSTWSKVDIASTDGSGGVSEITLEMIGIENESGSAYTRGEIFKVGSTDFLIAYKVPDKKYSRYDLSGESRFDIPPRLKVTPDTELDLCLINVATITQFANPHQFNLADTIKTAQDTYADVTGPAAETDAYSDLKQLGLWVVQYVQDYDEKCPPMKTQKAFHDAIYPYEKAEGVFIDPLSKQPFVPNPILSGKPMSVLVDPASFVLAYSPGVYTDGKRLVLFCDGRVRAVTDIDWKTLAKGSKIAITDSPDVPADVSPPAASPPPAAAPPPAASGVTTPAPTPPPALVSPTTP